MVVVLKRKEKVYKRTCKGCGSKLKIKKKEIKSERFGGAGWMDDPGKLRNYVECPACGENIFFSERQAV